MLRYTEKQYKSILNKRKYIDHWFWHRYSVSPYNGCQFGCIYCDCRSNKYHLATDFENDITIKLDPATMLDERLTKARTLLPDVIGLGGGTDAYQPAEKTYRNSRKILEVIEKHKYAVHLVTKSTLVEEDFELFDQIGKNAWACISATITTTNDRVARFLETRVTLPENRFKMLEKAKVNHGHIQAGISLIPVTPYLSDAQADLENLVRRAKDAGVDYILFGGGMTMRDTQALWFLKHLKETYPDLIPKYEKLYDFKYNPNEYKGTYGAEWNYLNRLNQTVLELCHKYDVPVRIKRFVPNDFRKHNYRIAELLLNHAYLLQSQGKKYSKLQWAGMHIQNLKEDIFAIKRRGELTRIESVGDSVAGFVERYFEKVEKGEE